MTKTIEPSRVGVIKKLQFTAPSITIKGFDPAGGWGILNISISAMAVPTAVAILHQWIPNNVMNTNPIKVAITCPPIMFLGCAKGLAGYANISKQLAPNDPKIIIISIEPPNIASVAVAIVLPSQATNIIDNGNLFGHWLTWLFNLYQLKNECMLIPIVNKQFKTTTDILVSILCKYTERYI